MRSFIDLHIRPSIENWIQVKRMIRKTSELGYHSVGISLPSNISKKKIQLLMRICNNEGLNLVTRLDLYPNTPRKLINSLRRFRHKFEVISVTCVFKPVARQAAKDHRVDLLFFLPDPYRRFFDLAEAQLASKALASLEIDMSSILFLRGLPRIQLISCLRREVKIAQKLNVPIVISSGATNEYFLKSPHDFASLATFFDLAFSCGLQALSKNPFTIVERNREKLSPNYIAPGIQIIKG